MTIPDTKYDLGRARFECLLEAWKKVDPQHPWIVRQGTDSIEYIAPSYSKALFPALGSLDDESWQVMLRNLAERYKIWTEARGSHQIFDLLDEALAYQHLVDLGFETVRLVPRSKEKSFKSPDISFVSSGQIHFCEVKSIGESDANRQLFEKCTGFDPRIYEQLNDGFFTKLCRTVDCARTQISQSGSCGLVYLIIRFDDFTGRYASTYREQIEAFFGADPSHGSVIVRFDRTSFMKPIIRIQPE